MKIAIFGLGYVGCVSAGCLSQMGHTIYGVDVDSNKVNLVNSGKATIIEDGLDELIENGVKSGNIIATTDSKWAVENSEIGIICVGTPNTANGHLNMEYILKVSEQIANTLKEKNDFYTITIRSTVMPGTNLEISRLISKITNKQADEEFAVVSNPEFLREGAAIEDFKRPDRVVIGVEEQRAKEIMEEIYRPLSLNAPPLVFVGRRTSELTKYAANAFLATKITFINEIADLCEKVGADVNEVARGIGLDKRIGAKFLHAGPGYGGSCFPKDTLALIKTGQDEGAALRIVETVVAVNDARKRAMARKIIIALGGSVRGKKIALLGLAFKPNTDDMRDAPSLAIVASLAGDGASVHAYDPESMEQARPLMPEVVFHNDAYAALEGAEAVAIVTEWDAFRALDLDRVKSLMKSPNIIDLRNIYRPADVRKRGFTYISVGRN